MSFSAHSDNSKHKQKSFFNGWNVPVFFLTPVQTRSLLSEGRKLAVIIRHGVTDWNAQMRIQGREDIPLNDEGRKQAHFCSDNFEKNLSLPDGIAIEMVTSPLCRAVETAEIISKNLGIDTFSIEEGLIERDYSEMSGLTIYEKRKKYKSPRDYPDDMEIPADACCRMKRTLAKICQGESSDSSVYILITHGGIMNAFFSSLTRGKVGNGKNITANCTFCFVAVGKKDVIPVAFNVHCEQAGQFLSEIYENQL